MSGSCAETLHAQLRWGGMRARGDKGRRPSGRYTWAGGQVGRYDDYLSLSTSGYRIGWLGAGCCWDCWGGGWGRRCAQGCVVELQTGRGRRRDCVSGPFLAPTAERRVACLLAPLPISAVSTHHHCAADDETPGPWTRGVRTADFISVIFSGLPIARLPCTPAWSSSLGVCMETSVLVSIEPGCAQGTMCTACSSPAPLFQLSALARLCRDEVHAFQTLSVVQDRGNRL
jgi:hypothetical protein